MAMDWKVIVPEAARIANSYNTAVTLRQLHYRLVASGAGGYVNTTNCYKYLSSKTAEARRDGSFPALSDRTRGTERPLWFADPTDAINYLKDIYRLDRTEDQSVQTWVLYEKATLGAQIESWTGEYGIPTAALRGYSSESLEREIFSFMTDNGRPIVVFYVGDLDPEGEDIERNFMDQAQRMGITFKHWERLTVLPSQIAQYGLVENPGKEESSRAAGFKAKYGRLFQIETEAIDPAVLERLVTKAITAKRWFVKARWEALKAQEIRDIAQL